MDQQTAELLKNTIAVVVVVSRGMDRSFGREDDPELLAGGLVGCHGSLVTLTLLFVHGISYRVKQSIYSDNGVNGLLGSIVLLLLLPPSRAI